MSKQIVVIGGGIAGKKVIEILADTKADIEMVLVDPKDYFEVPYAQFRAIVEAEGFGQTIRKSFREFLPDINQL